MKDLFEVELIEIDGKEELLIKKNEFFTAQKANKINSLKTFKEIKEDLEDRGTLLWD